MPKINPEFRELIPPLSESEYAELEQSILAEGCRDPLCVWNDTIVDGHHRYEICTKHGLPFATREMKFESKDAAIIWILGNQLARRNISEFSRIELALKRKDLLLKRGREKQKQTLGGYKYNEPSVLLQNNKTDETEKPDDIVLSNLDKTDEPHDTRQIIADELKIGSGTIGRAEQIIKHAPEELKEQLRKGDISINKAYKEIKLATAANKPNAPQIPSDKYRVIYADPPWKYNDRLVDGYGAAEFHYPSMTIEELCAMPIREIAEDNAVLFLWVTSPFLEDSFKVINSWGFKYKSSFVWDKVGHNYGHYNSVRHEFLLICTRGSCIPDNATLFDSVQSIPKSNEHSEKPEEFRNIIDTLYTNGKKLELFARGQLITGWERWGNEANG